MRSAEPITLFRSSPVRGGGPCQGRGGGSGTIATRIAASEIRLDAIARRLGLADRPLRAIIAKVRLLIDKRGFPLPRTPRFINGEPITGSNAVHAKSVWDRDLVDLWFEDDLPPATAATQRNRNLEATRADLAARAQGLVA